MADSDGRDGASVISRRRLLQGAGAVGLGAVVGLNGPRRWASAQAAPALWSDPATWSRGKVPGPRDNAKVDRAVLLDVSTRVAGVDIVAAGSLVFDPAVSHTLETTKNVVVRGRLVMRPASLAVIHRLKFVGVKESYFVGGGDSVIASDVGLWVIDNGVLDLAGSPRLAWARATGSIASGDTALELAEDPVGWRLGDEIVVTPTLSPSTLGHEMAYDRTTIAAVAGRTITLSAPFVFDHPAVKVSPDRTFAAEVLNLSRNVVIEGSASGRSHIFVRSTAPQSIRDTGVRYMGPRKGSPSAGVIGRYPLHIHHCDGGSQGTLVERLAVYDAGNHAIVTHRSHGVTYRDCISHDITDEAYWWDPAPDRSTPGEPTDTVLYERCVASLVRVGSKDFRLAGFNLGQGTGDIARDCVAVGVLGVKDGSGFVWPELSDGAWGFSGCLSHNNRGHGIFVWQNNSNDHLIRDFVAYHNGSAGISHGAYLNRYRYEDSILYGNLNAALIVQANSRPEAALTFRRIVADGAGLSGFVVEATDHPLTSPTPTMFEACTFLGYQDSALHFLGVSPTFTAHSLHRFDLVDCTYSGNEFFLESIIDPGSVIRVQDAVHGSILLRRSDQPGTLVPAWNARMEPIPPFV